MVYKITDFSTQSLTAYKQLFVNQNEFCKQIHILYKKHFPDWIYRECIIQIELVQSDGDATEVECNLPFLCKENHKRRDLYYFGISVRLEIRKQILGFIKEAHELYGNVVVYSPIRLVFDLYNSYFDEFFDEIRQYGFYVVRGNDDFERLTNAIVIYVQYISPLGQPLLNIETLKKNNVQIVNLSIASAGLLFGKTKVEEKNLPDDSLCANEINERYELCEKLMECVKQWNLSRYGFHYYSLGYYHPLNRGGYSPHDANRRFVWDFKDGVAYATNEVIKRTESVLREHFGELVSKLTFVCVTASTIEKTNRRYKVFAEAICKDLGMSNAFNHIRVVCNGISKHNCPQGVTPKLPKLEFDKEFFEGKQVVLFDDVISSGWAIGEYVFELLKLGAKPICAITVGETI